MWSILFLNTLWYWLQLMADGGGGGGGGFFAMLIQ
jgi:hypothetical protein